MAGPYKKQRDSKAIDDGWTITDGVGTTIAHVETETGVDALLGCYRGERHPVRDNPPAFKKLQSLIFKCSDVKPGTKIKIYGRECGGIYNIHEISWSRDGAGSSVQCLAGESAMCRLLHACEQWCMHHEVEPTRPEGWSSDLDVRGEWEDAIKAWFKKS